MIESLRKSQVFAGLDEAALGAIAGLSQQLELRNGQVLFADQSEEDHDLFLVVRGRLNVVKQYQARGAVRDMLLSPVEREVLGEVGWLTKTPRSAMIKAGGDALVLRIDGDKLDAFFQANPAAGYQVMRNIAVLLSNRLSNTNSVVQMFLSNAI